MTTHVRRHLTSAARPPRPVISRSEAAAQASSTARVRLAS